MNVLSNVGFYVGKGKNLFKKFEILGICIFYCVYIQCMEG
jgi:hypothetical protein